MKKLSSFLVLMLIVLMLFVSCNGSTPTKEESNSSSNGSTPTVTERAATDADYTLFATLSNVLMNDIVGDRIDYNVEIPEGCTQKQDNSTNTLSLTFDSCEFDSYNLDGSQLPVKLNGIATIKTEGESESENYVEYHTCNFTEGSSLGDTKFTINLEFSANNSGINFTTATINGIKIKGLSELVRSKAIREATPADVELTGMIYSAIGKIQAQIYNHNIPNNVDPVDNTLNFIGEGCTVNVSNSEDSPVYVKLVGSATIIEVDRNTTNFTCDLKAGTVIADVHHTVKAELTITTTNTGSSAQTMQFDVQEAFIDRKKVNNLDTLLNASNT